MAKDDKGKIVFVCTFVMVIFILLCFQSVRQFRESNSIREKDEQVEQQHNLALSLFKTDVDFFGYELNNSEFYKSGNSIYLARHDSLLNTLHQLLEVFQDDEAQEDSIVVYLYKYDSAFDDIVSKIKSKGYRDYGLEGRMRVAAHRIEREKRIPLVDYLQLRRMEKDYLLRADPVYIEKFDSIVSQITSRNPAVTTRAQLKEYSETFHELTSLGNKIGLETQANLKRNIDNLNGRLLTKIKERDVLIDQHIHKFHQNGLILFIIGMIGSTVVCFSLIVIIARKLG